MSRVKVTVTKGHEHYFYETEERIMRCPICKREYFTRKVCLHCSKNGKKERVPTQLFIKQHTGMITKDLKRYSCSCVFSSFFGWSKFWKDNHPRSRCKHLKWALKKLNEKRKTMPGLWK